MATEEVTVLVLDDGPEAYTTPWGWRGDIVFRGRWDAKPAEIARTTSERLSRNLASHAVVHYRGRAWVILREATDYRFSASNGETPPPDSQTRIRAHAPRRALAR